MNDPDALSPGRLCIVTSDPWFGWPVRLIRPAPADTPFELPTGIVQEPIGPNHWICESLAGPAPTSTGRRLCFGAIPADRLAVVTRRRPAARRGETSVNLHFFSYSFTVHSRHKRGES